ncbi:hypothetical protein C8N35_102386 [Breoghania corrubedonensis]|uniref:PH (Pleckstrin Homology) domain-containing protein n=1 Tax=Breoghania corrubedonensis TaxID=665038 RepID=A0A2T5VD50_9HYPH|nr:STM3941 family protein [Breoghania corrubedonensis]PTW61671.1 hypothetical protein C8N35_102386 [Breoghania corrubedonensis]
MTLSARYDRKKLTVLLIVSLVFTGVSYALAMTSDPFVFGVAQVAFLFFVGLTFLNLIRLMDDREVLRIDEAGVFDRRLADETIPWRVVEDVKEIRMLGLRFFAVVSREPITSFIKTRFKRMMAWLNSKLGFHPVGITTHGLNISYADLHEAFAAYAPKPQEESEEPTN